MPPASTGAVLAAIGASDPVLVVGLTVAGLFEGLLPSDNPREGAVSPGVDRQRAGLDARDVAAGSPGSSAWAARR